MAEIGPFEIVNSRLVNPPECLKSPTISRENCDTRGQRATAVGKPLPRSQRGGQGFKSPQLHDTKRSDSHESNTTGFTTLMGFPSANAKI